MSDLGVIGRRWARLAGCLAAILLFAFVALPLIQRLGPVHEVRSAIHAADIDATALFYTESEASAESEASLRNSLRYPASNAFGPSSD